MNYLIKSNLDENLNCWQISLHGEIDIFNSNDMKLELLTLIEKNNVDLKIDCKNLNFIDSTTLGSLVAVQKEVKKYDGTVYLSNLQSSILKLLKITNLDKTFKIIGDYYE